MKFLFSILLVFGISYTGLSQSIYHFQYRFTNDSTVYEAFFVRNEDGSGILRVKYQLPGSNELAMAEMSLEERYPEYSPGNADTTRLFYKTSKPEFIIGNNQQAFTSPVFWFTKNTEDGLFEPGAVSSTEENNLKSQGTILKKDHLKANDLTKNFVLQFFTDEEDFYKNLFVNNTRGLSPLEKKTRIILLVVANTNDSIIGSSCRHDMDRIVQTFRDLAIYLGIEKNYFPKTIYGKEYNLKNIQQAIKQLNPDTNDIVIFYYSGHGFRKAGDKRRFPFLDFRAKPRDDYKVYSMNVEDIFTTIFRKKGRFNLVLTDCCNNEPGSSNAIGRSIPEERGSALEWNEDNIRKLFLNPKRMSVMASAADIGQKASGNNNFGGFFSYYFKSAMENYFSVFRTAVTWDQVLQAAAVSTIRKADNTYCAKPYIPENICKQYPFYKIVVGR